MKQNVFDGVVAIEAKAAKVVEEAKAQARQTHQKAEAQLERLAQQLDQEAEAEIATYRADLESRKAAALGKLDQQLEAALQALETVKAEGITPLVEEVVRLLEQRADGD